MCENRSRIDRSLGVTSAKTLDRQGETKLAADVRKFVQEMPPVMTDKEQLAYQFVQSFNERTTPQKSDPVRVPERTR